MIEFFRNLYEYEHATKERINANLPFWLTLYSTQIAISAYYLSMLENPYFELWHLAFYVPFILAVAYMVNSVISVVRCFRGSQYAFLGKPSEYYKYYIGKKSQAKTSDEHEAEFNEEIAREYAEAADFNREVNKRRLETNLHAVKNTFAAFIFLILSYPGNLLIKAHAPETDTSISTKQPLRIIMSDDNDAPPPPAKPSEPAAKAPAQPTPSLPKLEYITECLANSARAANTEEGPSIGPPPDKQE